MGLQRDGVAAAQVGLAIVFLANRAVLMVDAIMRTLVRMYVSRRHLLEWVTAAQGKRGVSRTLAQAYGVVGDYMPDGWRAQQAFPFHARPAE